MLLLTNGPCLGTNLRRKCWIPISDDDFTRTFCTLVAVHDERQTLNPEKMVKEPLINISQKVRLSAISWMLFRIPSSPGHEKARIAYPDR